MLEDKKKLTRRDMLKLSGTVAAGALLASCSSPTPDPTEETMPEEGTEEEVVEEPKAPAITGTVVAIHSPLEFTEDYVNEFQAENPGVTIEIVDWEDQTRFWAMYAAGTPPDIYRCQAPSVPVLLARQLLLDLTPYFESSEMIAFDDLLPANDYYKANSPLDVGSGPIYGMAKDFSPDMSVFVNTALFEAAGLPEPSDTEPMTYDDIMTYAKDLTVFDGERMMQYAYFFEPGWVDRLWQMLLAETGETIYSEGYNKLEISANESAKAVVKWYYDMCEKRYAASSQMPSPSGWAGNDFLANTVAILNYGFWFSAMAESDENRGDVKLLPAPTWSGGRFNNTFAATGAVMTKDAPNPDAGFKAFEYFHAGTPAVDRAGSGWGVPALKSLVDLIPQETDFQKQCFNVLQGELALESPPLQFNPFVGENMIPNAWGTHLDQALTGEITFDEMVINMEAEVNTGIQESIDRVMG